MSWAFEDCGHFYMKQTLPGSGVSVLKNTDWCTFGSFTDWEWGLKKSKQIETDQRNEKDKKKQKAVFVGLPFYSDLFTDYIDFYWFWLASFIEDESGSVRLFESWGISLLGDFRGDVADHGTRPQTLWYSVILTSAKFSCHTQGLWDVLHFCIFFDN